MKQVCEGIIGVFVIGVVLGFFAVLYVVALPVAILSLPFERPNG